MEERKKSTVAAEGDNMDQKLPAEPKRTSKGSAREKAERDAKRRSGRSGSSVPGAQALNEILPAEPKRTSNRSAREKAERDAKRKSGRSGSSVPGAQALNEELPAEPKRSFKGSDREKSERDTKRRSGRSRSFALNMAGEIYTSEKSDRSIKRAARAGRSAPTTPGAHNSTDRLVRVAKNAAMTKLQDLVHRDQKGMKRQQLEDKSKANLPFLELTLLPHRMQDISKLVSLHPQDTVLSTKKERKRISQLNLWQ
jgi:hypothetical protein